MRWLWRKTKKTNKKDELRLVVLLGVAALVLGGLVIFGNDFAVLDPKGSIAQKERNLIIFGALLSVIIVIPVFIMTFYIAWKYRASNTKATYLPDWDHNRTIEALWWGIPTLLILILSVVTWNSSHDLDPFKPLQSDKQPLSIQVVALNWKWLFIYPDHNLASVNYVQFPVNRPVNFEITSDAPMNSFWIPQLGGQIYAMSAMSTKLHLMANEVGDYNGSSANISGRGFAGMRFTARASSETEFNEWVDATKIFSNQLDASSYLQLAKPSEYNPVAFYSPVENNLYNRIITKYTLPETVDTKPEGHGSHQ